jgi:Tfp pilus assembly protein PilV
MRSLLTSRTVRPRTGLSLLEVILATAILGLGLAAIGELVRLGSRQAEESRDLAIAQLLCESKLEEIAAGAASRESVSSSPCETNPDWQYSVTVTSLGLAGLSEVRVTVEQNIAEHAQPLSFTLVRWMLDETQSTSGSSTQSGTTGTTSSGGTTSGGSNGTGL